MSIAELSVRRPVTIVMVYVFIIIVACVFIPRLGIAMFPETTFPMLSVMTSYPNVGPEEIDTTVTQVLVNQLSRVSDLKSVSSTSQSGSSRIFLEFGYDKDMTEAYNDVQTIVSRAAGRLPDNCNTPSVMKFDMGSMPIMRLSVEGDLPIDNLKSLAEDTVSPYIERIDGVASVEVMGGASKTVRVDVYYNRLEAYGLSLTSVSSALAARNIQTSIGTITQGTTDYEVITSEYFGSLDEIRNTIISTKDGATIKVDDVADVYEKFETSRSVYINGVPGLYLSVSNESGTNAATISKEVRKAIDEINAELPEGVVCSVMSDDTSMIDSTMKQVYKAGIEGALLAMAIILLFLRNIRSSLIIGLSIPICIVITLLGMALMDLTINLMTMAGLILGIGMVVDSSIVILENIYIHRENGEQPAVAAILGSRNMINAIVASTLTTVCVFVPVIIYKAELEMIGQLFSEMVITVVISLVASLFVAVTIVPALCGSILPIYTKTQKQVKNRFISFIDRKIESALNAVEKAYVKSLNFCLHNKFIVIAMILMILVFSIIQISSFGMNLAPNSSSDDQVNVTVTLPVGTNNDVVLDYLFKFQDIVNEQCGDAVKSIVINSGTANSGSVQINLPELEKQTMNPDAIKKALTPYLKEWSDVTVSFSSGRGGFGSGSAINIQLISKDTEASQQTAEEIVDILKTIPLVTDPKTDFENGDPRYRLVIDTETAAAADVSVSTIATAIRAAVSGISATEYHKDGSEYTIKVILRDEDLKVIGDIGAITIPTKAGRMTLDNFISYEEGRSPQKIQREDSERVNRVTASLAEGTTATEAQAVVEKVLSENLVVPDTVEVRYSGDARDIQKFGGKFKIIIILACLLVFAVMAAQFESMIDPFIIFMSIPLLAIGIVAVYKITGQTFSLYSIVGVVALVGIVVNNGIVLVDYTNQLVDKKTPVLKACLEAGQNRLRPILMSTLTTVLGMVPMAFFPGEGAESMQPICITIVGGLTSGAFMTLYLSPIMYILFNKRREKRFDNPDALMNQLESPLLKQQ